MRWKADSLAARDRNMAVVALLLAGVVVYPLALVLPLIRVERLLFFATEHSLLSIVTGLIQSGNWLIGIILLIFSIVLPGVKLGYLIYLYFLRPIGQGRNPNTVNRLEALGRWAMLDVLVVALVIFSLRAGGLASAFVQPGLYLFIFLALSLHFLAWRLRRILARPGG